MDKLLAIGALSRESGVKVPAIRYYEQVGLLPPPPRTASQRRVYDYGAVRRLRFIRHSRELGFEIEDIRTLLAMSAEPQASCDQADSIARRHLGQVERRIAQLGALREELQRMIAECDRGQVCDCRVIEVLADHGLCQHEHG
jgi:DNA-binding transcriptional MerR regulator